MNKIKRVISAKLLDLKQANINNERRQKNKNPEIFF